MKDLVDKKVVHVSFGEGSIIKCSDSYIEVKFKTGDKLFSFPDAFNEYITFADKESNTLVNKQIKEKQKEQEKEELILEEERALELERRNIFRQKERIKSGKVSSEIQSVFWVKEEEKEEIFSEWKVFIGKIKSGDKKGQPRKLSRMNKNSACLLTERKEDVPEEDRRIIGAFMASQTFDGRLCEDGYIDAHPDYRLHLSEEESEKMLFWNYYSDKQSSDKTVWNSGRQRYFNNMWMAQILLDIIKLREDQEGKEQAQEFFDYFCKINFINTDEIPKANGALIN